MADDARISTALPRHPKTVKLQRRLGPSGCWSLICLFLWVADNRPDGDLKGMTAEDIEIAANWTGDPGAFVASLREVRFVDGEIGALRVHDWAEHNPWAAGRPQRIAAAKAAANARWAKGMVTTDDARSMPAACETHESAMPTSPPLTTPRDTETPNSPFLENQSSLQKKKGKSDFSQADFDARDMRKMQEAEKEFRLKAELCVGNTPAWMRNERKVFEWICCKAGVSVKRGLELEELQKKWPEEIPVWAKDAACG